MSSHSQCAAFFFSLGVEPYFDIRYPDALSGGELDQLLALGWFRMHQAIFTTSHLQREGLFRVHWLRFTKSRLLSKLNRQTEADETMKVALENASAQEMHQYGRQLLSEKKTKEAFAVFEKNFKKNKGAWPTHVGMMRGYSALGDLKKALEHARLALAQAPNDVNKQSLEQAIKTLESGKPL